MPDTTPAPEGDQSTQQSENWEQRYLGLQKVVAKRDADLNTRQAALDALAAEHEAAMTELSDFRQKTVDASEEQAARQQYEQLHARFAPPPRTVGTNPSREWTTPASDGYAARERKGDAGGFPV